MIKISSIVNRLDARPIIQAAAGLLVGRYVSRFPMKVTVPLTCAAICGDWIIRKTSSPGYLRQISYVCSTVTISCYAANAFPTLAKRIPDIAGLWLSTIAAPSIITKTLEAVTAWFAYLHALRGAKALVMHEMQTLFREYFSNKESLESLASAKNDLFYNNKLSTSCEGTNKEGNKLKIDFEVKDSRIDYSVYSNGIKRELSKVERQMLEQVLIPGRPYFEASLATAAAELTTEKAKHWLDIGRSQMCLKTADGRFWMFWILKENDKNEYSVLQVHSSALKSDGKDQSFITKETVGCWKDQGTEKGAIEITPQLYSYVVEAYKVCLKDEPDYLNKIST